MRMSVNRSVCLSTSIYLSLSLSLSLSSSVCLSGWLAGWLPVCMHSCNSHVCVWAHVYGVAMYAFMFARMDVCIYACMHDYVGMFGCLCLVTVYMHAWIFMTIYV